MGFIKLNIGGSFYSTSLTSLNKSKYFKDLFENNNIIYDDYKNIFVDREGKYFKYILKYLRGYNNYLPKNESEFEFLLEESQFFQLEDLTKELQDILNKKDHSLEQNINKDELKKNLLNFLSIFFTTIELVSKNFLGQNFDGFSENLINKISSPEIEEILNDIVDQLSKNDISLKDRPMAKLFFIIIVEIIKFIMMKNMASSFNPLLNISNL